MEQSVLVIKLFIQFAITRSLIWELDSIKRLDFKWLAWNVRKSRLCLTELIIEKCDYR